MSQLAKSIQAFPAAFFLQSGFSTKNQGLEHLKSEIFAPVFASHKKAFDELVGQVADSIRPLYLANVEKLPVLAKGKKKSPKKVKEEVVDLDEEDFSDESEPDEEPEPVKVAPKKKAQPKAQPKA